jgi:hypothetical protein
MSSRNRSIVGALCLVALAALSYGCQAGDEMFPTEAQRSLQTSVDASEVFAKIDEVITSPTLGRSVKKQFTAIVKALPRKPNDAKAKARSLTDFILKHYQAGKWEGADATGELVALILAYVGIIPEAQGATTCIPGVDCTGEAEKTDNGNAEFAGAKIPGDLVNVPFVLLFTPNVDKVVKPPLFGLVYDITTYPAGITFPNSSPGGSLTLASEDDQPVAGVCTLLGPPAGIPDGVHPDSLHVVHFENGVWVRLPQVAITFLDCENAGETESALWSNPILQTVVDLLSPGPAVAAGIRTGGAITSFSPYATEVAGTLPTTSTISVVSGGPVLHPGETITLRVEVYPEPPDDPAGVLFRALPTGPAGAASAELVGGVAEHTYTCGDPQVHVGGSYDAVGNYLGAEGFAASQSTEDIEFSCVPAED